MAAAKATVQKTPVTDEQVEKAEQNLPPQGHERREELKRQEDNLQAEIDRMSEQFLSGTIDSKSLDIVNEIANKTQYLSVSNPQPGRVYCWASKNRHGQHIQKLKQVGWQTVQGDDPEAVELKGLNTGLGGDPGSTRSLGDVVLMWLPRERYIVLKAKHLADTQKRSSAAVSNLLELGDRHRHQGFIVRPYYEAGVNEMTPELKPQRFSSQKGAMQALDTMLRQGKVPGAEITPT